MKDMIRLNKKSKRHIHQSLETKTEDAKKPKYLSVDVENNL